MFNFFRLIVLLFLSVLSFNSFASFPASSSLKYRVLSLSYSLGDFDSVSDMENFLLSYTSNIYANVTGPYYVSFNAPLNPGGSVSGRFYYYRGSYSSYSSYNFEYLYVSSCPANSSVSGAQCTCNSGYEEKNNQCVLPAKTCNFGDIASSGYYDVGKSASGSPAITACLGGCATVFNGTSPAGNALVDGVKHYFALGSYTNIGPECSGSGEGAVQGMTTLPPDTCGQGQVMGKFNGKNVCVKAPDSDSPIVKQEPPTVTETETKNTVKDQDESGNARETTTTVKTNSDGSTTTTVTTTTTSPDGSTSSNTTTTTTGGSGGGGFGGGSQDGEGSEDGECAKNPSDKGCGGTAADISGKNFHTAKGKTFSTVLQSASDDIKASPIGNSFTGFFTVSGGGTCPVSTWNIPYLNAVVAFDFMCQSFVLDGLLILKGVLLLVASFFAFRVAVE